MSGVNIEGSIMTLVRTVGVALLLAAFCGCVDKPTEVTPAAGSDIVTAGEGMQDNPTAIEVARTYGQLRLMTKGAVDVDLQLATLCVSVSPQRVDVARKQYGPHAHTSIRIFMNDDAADAFLNSANSYPVGSIIVKEKHGLSDKADGNLPQSTGGTPDGVGGMIKRPAGYDRDHGDWAYFYFADPLKVENGKIASCIECHQGAATSDYVFGHWASGVR